MPDAFFPSLWQNTNPLSYNQRDVYGSQNFSLWNSGNGEITNEPYQDVPA